MELEDVGDPSGKDYECPRRLKRPQPRTNCKASRFVDKAIRASRQKSIVGMPVRGVPLDAT